MGVERARLHHELTAAAAGPATEPRSGRLLASWQRSQDYGVSMDSVDPAFSGTVDEDSLFAACGREVLTDLYRSLANEPVSAMLTDADGLVLNRFSGDSALLRALDRVHLAPGFSYAEREAGTNGLGLALADQVPTVVHAEEHFSASLCTYTCAAAPVLDPVTGRLEGSVNLTTWSDQSSDLLLALAQSAASNTASMMLTRGRGQRTRHAPRGTVFRVERARLEPGTGTEPDLSEAWARPRADATDALAAGQVLAVVGERGSGRTTLAAQAVRAARPGDRILAAGCPAPPDVDTWLALWTPELVKAHTAVVVRDVDALPLGAAGQLRMIIEHAKQTAPAPGPSVTLTAESFTTIPEPLATLVDSVATVPPLRDRIRDIEPLALAIAQLVRRRPVEFTPAALHVLTSYGWPGNVAELTRVVRHAAALTDRVDSTHLPHDVFHGDGADRRHRLSRIEAFERDEIIRVLNLPGITMKQAAEELGMGRATIYRKINQYAITVPR